MHHNLVQQVKYNESSRIPSWIQFIQWNLDWLKWDISRERIKEEIKRDEEAIIDWLEDWLEKEKWFGTIDTKLTVKGKKVLAPILENIIKVYEMLYGKKGIKQFKDLLESPDEAPFFLIIEYKYLPGEHRYTIPSIKLFKTDENPIREKGMEKN